MMELVEIILEAPMELQVIIGSGLIMILYEYLKREVWEKSKQRDHKLKKY